jgi:hypothetical protein
MTDLKLERKEAERDRIRAIFAEFGGRMPLRDVARYCLEAGVWDETQIEGMTINGAIKRVKDAVRIDDDGSNLPWAAAVEKGRNAVWVQRELFTYADYVSVIGMGVEALGADHSKLRSWQAECRTRHGTAPSIPDLV